MYQAYDRLLPVDFEAAAGAIIAGAEAGNVNGDTGFWQVRVVVRKRMVLGHG
jgi:hypothetical protein